MDYNKELEELLGIDDNSELEQTIKLSQKKAILILIEIAKAEGYKQGYEKATEFVLKVMREK